MVFRLFPGQTQTSKDLHFWCLEKQKLDYHRNVTTIEDCVNFISLMLILPVQDP
jgi:hypothetical protein